MDGEPMNDYLGSTIASRFRVNAQIGEGQMGAVFSAIDTVLGRKVAIKILKRQLATDQVFLERFWRESKIVAQLSSNPHVVTIYDVGKTDLGLPFLVMEYLEGHALTDEMSDDYRPSRTWVLDAGVQIAYALIDAHSKGVVHRDLKPATVFVMQHGVLPLLVKVLD